MASHENGSDSEDIPIIEAPASLGEDAPEPPSSDSLIAHRSRLPHPHIGWALLWIVGFWAVQLAVSFVAMLAMVLLAVAQGKRTPEELTEMLSRAGLMMIPIGTFFSLLTAVIVALVFFRGDFSRRLALRPIAWHQWISVVLLVLPMGILASEVTNCASEVLPQFNAEILEDFSQGHWLLVFVAACLFPALGEEIFCRGFLGRGLVANHGPWLGVLLASLLFGIMHIDPVQATGAFTLGLALHFIYLMTRSLLAPIVLHMLNNALAFLVIRTYHEYPVPGFSPLPDGTMVHTPIPVLLAASVAAACLCFVMYQNRTRWLLADEGVWSPGYVTAEQPPRNVEARPVAGVLHPFPALGCVITYAILLATLLAANRAVAA